MHWNNQILLKYFFLFSVLFIPGCAESKGFIYQSDPFWLWQFLGRLHPMIIHFPLSLLLLAAVLEAISIRQFQSRWRSAIDVMLWTGGIGAVLSAALGYMLMVNDQYEGDLVSLHQKLGITTAALSLICIFLSVQSHRTKSRNWITGYRGVFFISIVFLVMAGHNGAMLTHGSDYLTEVFPAKENSDAPANMDLDIQAYLRDTGELTEQAKLSLLTGVRTVFAHNCYKCHSSDKTKGELRLDEREFALKGGEDGPVIIAGKPGESELIRRIKLPAGHDDVMPNKGDLLSKNEISMISLWIEKGAYWPENVEELKIFRNAPLAPRFPEWPSDTSRFKNKIDLWVNQYFEDQNIEWPAKVDDRAYLRRIYLDIIGLFPSPEEITRFQEDNRPDKRNIWARNLLDQNEDYALHWLTFWNDILRNDYTGTGYITGGRHSITEWLYQSLYDNKSYQTMVKELLSPDEESKGFIAGIQWRGVVNASQRTEMQAAQNVAQVLLGLNLKCASCHDSFISDWKLEDAYGFANIFSETTMEINRCDKPTGKMAPTRLLWEELGTIDSTVSRDQRLKDMSVKLTSPENGRLYRTIVNRVWARLLGRGIVEPVDEMDQLPWSQDLLDWMEVTFVGNGFDLKNLIFSIVTSETYQLPAIPVENNLTLRDENYVFRGPVLRKITAEQFSDMVSLTFGPLFSTKESKFAPPGKDTTFIRASQVANNAFLTALGRPNREVVVTTRTDQPNLLQALELTNGNRLQSSLQEGAKNWSHKYSSPEILINQTYEELLGREPLQDEKEIAKEALGPSMDTARIQDFFWAMVLHPEVQFIN